MFSGSTNEQFSEYFLFSSMSTVILFASILGVAVLVLTKKCWNTRGRYCSKTVICIKGRLATTLFLFLEVFKDG